ncbi:HAD family hydrolase [Zophobihabitans entericus]|uniref:phosphoglycolate phosphatase n=1 Tax=Zophobihabitans entericus TaxID=1635327 RepID=A0A6G9ICK5_9GAMM|nr:HAD family phosphatase [Zophobihabitans entericus]QIQ21965.1 HAD family phosphatase [Zophobihabitans entericus]
MKNMKAVVFDFDGTLVDTEAAVYHATKDYFEKNYNYPFTIKTYQYFVGRNLQWLNSYTQKHLLPHFELEPFVQYVKQWKENNYHHIPMRPGALELIKRAKQHNLKLAIATSSTRDDIDVLLEKYQLLPYFDAIATADQVKELKPHPDLYLLALERLNILSAEAFAIEDTPTGSLAALNANLTTLIVTNEITEGMQFPDSVIHKPSFANILN